MQDPAADRAGRPAGESSKALFTVDLDDDTVTSPAGQSANSVRDRHRDGTAPLGNACHDCPQWAQCTTRGR